MVWKVAKGRGWAASAPGIPRGFLGLCVTPSGGTAQWQEVLRPSSCATLTPGLESRPLGLSPGCEPRGWGPMPGPEAASQAHWLVSWLWAQLPPSSWQTSESNREGAGPGLSESQEPIL